MSEYKRTKSESSSLIGSGLRYESGPSAFQEVEQLPGGFMVDTMNRIDYNVGQPFNGCSHVRSNTGIGLPADCASFTTRLLHTVSGLPDPNGRDPIVTILPSRLTMQRPLLGDKTLENDTDKAVGERYDAYNRLIHLVRKVQVGQHGMNVSQAVMELKDTKDTFDQLFSFMRWVKSNIGRGPVRVAKGVFRPLRLASSLADCAKAYLWYKFGVEPTARDIAEFRQQLADGRLRVKGSLQTKTRVATKDEVIVERWSTARTKSDIAAAMFDMSEAQTKGGYASGSGVQEGFRLPNGVSRILLPLPGPAKGWRNAYRVISRSMRGCYFARVKEDIIIDGLDDLRRRFGWDCPALKTVWELIPFSFLVDWVVDVGSFIERLEKRYLYEDYSHSLGPVWGTEEYREDVYVPALQRFDTSFTDLARPADTSYGGSLNLRWAWSAGVRRISSRSVFNRRVASVPSVLWPMLQKKIRAYQISTGMALIAQLGREFGRAH